ncbi:glycosyl hydrolase family 95 catalytic domain-containing protein [Subtercola frigoramans]|uniref:Glycosyl hydrolase family 95 N-terminal domain-containing protein n=1 Tax=Subtercola frigoramans TaxID=120298 RepID=A0ABS2L0S6_9MICO|nr:glycoside hydrolase N-terminal domain-containing protein [Subtercola frigoramans]MBM7470677.1 hypothetical protein [Subtercola frigoramans]
MTVWSSTLASSWETGAIAGTGVVGALVYGEPSRHVIVLSHERFFVPANSRRPAPDLAPALPQARLALAEGDEKAAADAIEQRLVELGMNPEELVWTDPLGPIAQLSWQPDLSGFSDYQRVLRTDDLGAEIRWKSGSGWTGIRVDATHGAEFFDIELSSDTALTGILTLEQVSERRAGADTVETLDYSRFVATTCSVSSTSLSAAISAAGYAPETDITARVEVTSTRRLAPTGTGWRVTLDPGERLSFRVDVTTDGAGPRYVDPVSTESLASSSFSLLGASTCDHVESVFGDAHAGVRAAVHQMLELGYAAGRRNIIASCGALPPTLQGVWQGTWSPAWSADYTMNGNVQLGTLASVLWTGNPSLMRSLFRMIRQFPEDFRSNARAIYGVPGMMLPARLSTHGHANHFNRDFPHQFWIGHGNWLLRMAADYVQVTGDRSIIDEWLWEYAVEILTFGLAVVADGDGHLSPSYSPENTPGGSDNPLSIDSTADIGALRDGLRVGAWLAGLRGDEQRAEQWTSARSALPPYRIAGDATLAEWGASVPERLEHRHASQLHGLWHEPDEAFERPELRAAAQATVRAKAAWRAEAPHGPPGHQEMAFGLSSIALAAAALGDGETAAQCAYWLALDHFTHAMVSTHDAGSIFNLDASGALPAVIAAMLVASTTSTIHLLPALPLLWEAGAANGLTARGGAVIHELRWSPSTLSCDVELRSEAAWLRPSTTVLLMPRAGNLRTTPHASQTNSTRVEIESTGPRVRLCFDFADQTSTQPVE